VAVYRFLTLSKLPNEIESLSDDGGDGDSNAGAAGCGDNKVRAGGDTNSENGKET
jgi:hypothetical protein